MPKSSAIVFRLGLAAVCAVSAWQSWKLLQAGLLFRQDTEQSVRAAIRKAPDAWPYYHRLAQLDEANAKASLTRATELNQYDAQAYTDLALQEEAEGDKSIAEQELLAAYNVDRTYLPRWSLANFYLRQNSLPAFWIWARRAAERPADDMAPLFELCWRVSPDAQTIAANLFQGRSRSSSQFIQFLLSKQEVDQAAALAPDLIAVGNAESDGPLLLSLVDGLVDAGEPAKASVLWTSLALAHWIVADGTKPNNNRFTREPLPVRFDWRLGEGGGYHSWLGPHGLETEFSGEEPEQVSIAEQSVVLAPGSYAMKYTYQTSGIASGTGLRWQLADAKSLQVIAESADLSSETLVQATQQVSIPPGASLVQLRYTYHRTPGTTPIAGTATMRQISLEGIGH